MNYVGLKLSPEKVENAVNFLNANYSNDELEEMKPLQVKKILLSNKKEWNYPKEKIVKNKKYWK